MGHREWEEDRVKLPAAGFACLRKAIQDADSAHKEKVSEMTQDCWKTLTRKEQTDLDVYRTAHRPSGRSRGIRVA
ncbi:hypothetical protein [Arthrobacter mobilis]|uniref:Uncharacterized protein n=1 Tax=Arthrobacter mobilis TaxID=2724944 RepID=A0A7X6HF66_9MICC|nr:hypothetical protein [Arthrobacter mobilis]NKX55961.1 hypothetical protein [Arthrobacter mobilis]